jgi:hypothetical protein
LAILLGGSTSVYWTGPQFVLAALYLITARAAGIPKSVASVGGRGSDVSSIDSDNIQLLPAANSISHPPTRQTHEDIDGVDTNAPDSPMQGIDIIVCFIAI